MGFSNVIYKYPKYKDTTLNQIFNMENYFNYDSNEWAKKNFSSATEYMNYNNGYGIEKYVAPTEEQLNFYKQFLHKDEFNHIVIHDYVYDNCSNGIPFHEDISNYLNKEITKSVILTQKDIINLLQLEIKNFDKYRLYPASIDYSFRFVEPDDDPDDYDVILKRCDGVEVSFDDNLIKRVETSNRPEYGISLMMPKQYIEEYEYNAYIYLIQSLSDILATTDFNNEVLEYSGGW